MKTGDVLWNRAYVLLSVSNFFAWLSYNMVTPVMTSYMETLGASVTICGVVGGIFAFTSLVSRPFSGRMADTFNRKWLMGLFTFVMTFSLLIYAIVPSIPVILILRGLHGVAFGISSTASLVLVSECVSESRMGEAISYYGVMSVASMAIGPGLGIFISDALGYRACMLVGTLILGIASVAVLGIPYTRPGCVGAAAAGPQGGPNCQGNSYCQGACGRTADKAVKDRHGRIPAQGSESSRSGLKKLAAWAGRFVELRLLDLSAVNASFTLMNGVVSTFLVVYAAQLGIEGVSWHFTVNAAVLIVLRILLAKQMNLWTLKQNLYPAFICGIVTVLIIGRGRSLALFIIAACFKAVAQSMSQPALQTEAFRAVPYKKRGLASSTMYIGGDLGQAVGPMVGGAIAQAAGYGNMYLICALPLAAAFIYFALIRCRRAR